MKTTVIIGVDCATDPKRTGIARALYQDGVMHLQAALAGRDANYLVDTLAGWMEDAERVLLCLDAPLGWPLPLGEQLAGHQAGELLIGDGNNLFRRETDRRIRKYTGKVPLDVGADRIARTAHAALKLLDRLRDRTGFEIPLAWEPGFETRAAAIEVYPAGTLAALEVPGLPSSRYKGRENEALRCEMLDKLPDYFVPEAVKNKLGIQDDVFDAVLCTLAGRHFLDGVCHQPEDLPLAKKEGWIWVTTKGN